MPKTRTDKDRDTKVAEILEASERRLREGGYGALSVASLARELGLAHNAIYWYFPSKDHLVVATFDHIIHKLMARKPKDSPDVVEKVMWFVDQLGELYPLRASLHERAQQSELISSYLDGLNESLRRMTSGLLSAYVPADELEIATTAFIATVQGAFLGGMPARERKQMLRFALNRLITSS